MCLRQREEQAGPLGTAVGFVERGDGELVLTFGIGVGTCLEQAAAFVDGWLREGGRRLPK
jgi:hypothetical protein